jgi:hypothetical protein
MARIEFDMDAEIPPERIIAALTDFSGRRPDIWPGLKREEYEVYEVRQTGADVREGTSKGVWARERYDWSQPGVVRWEVVESSFCAPGSYVEARIAPKDRGSRIHVTWERHPTTFMARAVMIPLIKLTGGAPVKSSLRKGLERIKAGADQA